MNDSQALDYCRDTFARDDHARYLISLLMPENKRPALWVLGAFRATLESIPATVTDPTLGYMRLTWWRDQVGLLEQGTLTDGHPILAALRRYLPMEPELTALIDDCEIFIEQRGAAFASLAYDRMLKKILGEAQFKKYLKLEHYAETLMQKYASSKWRGTPPFFALRLATLSLRERVG